MFCGKENEEMLVGIYLSICILVSSKLFLSSKQKSFEELSVFWQALMYLKTFWLWNPIQNLTKAIDYSRLENEYVHIFLNFRIFMNSPEVQAKTPTSKRLR